jgi:hypothetical protein
MKPVKSAWLVCSVLATMGAALAVAADPQAPPAGAPGEAADASTDVALGRRFESQSAGISFCPVSTLRLVDRTSESWVGEWATPDLTWRLTLGRVMRPEPIPLVSGTDNFGKPTTGLLEALVEKFKAGYPGCKILRQDVTNIANGGIFNPRLPGVRQPNVGLIAVRYTEGAKHFLRQEALIQASDRLYYVLALTTPGDNAAALPAGDNVAAIPAAANPPAEDPGERLAVESFAAMLDSIQLADFTAIRQEQDDRLIRTQDLLINFTSNRLHKVLVKEQWLRVLKDGKDVGYSYITEESAAGIPRKLTPSELREGKNVHDLIKPGDGILIGIRARMIQDSIRSDKKRGSIQTDSHSWFFATADRKHEEFTRLVVSDDHVSKKPNFIQEVGDSEQVIKPKVVLPPPQKGLPGPNKPQVQMKMRDDVTLDVTLTGNENVQPLHRQLPPWYISQAVGHLLPRILPRTMVGSKGYLFASYVSETREVMLRYVDVLPEQRLKFNGEWINAIPIRDRLGIDGSVTTHYVSKEGVYLGSENFDEKIVVIPTDAATLSSLWQNADLNRPEGAGRERNAPAR